MRVLVTGGGCDEPIDGVRSLCNFSSGRTASVLAERFAEAGHEVVALMAERAVHPRAVRIVTFRTCADLGRHLEAELSAGIYDLVVHAAAVSDFRPGTVEVNGVPYRAGSVPKIASGASVVIRLRENPKLVDSLRLWSKNTRCGLVAFKLTNGETIRGREEAVRALLARSGVDLVVSNDLSEISGDRHPVCVYAGEPSGAIECVFQGLSNQDLADFIAGRFARAREYTDPTGQGSLVAFQGEQI